MKHSISSRYLGRFLCQQRIKKDYLQRDLADSIGCSAQFLGRIENEDVPIPERLFVELISRLEASKTKARKLYLKGCGEHIDSIFDGLNN